MAFTFPFAARVQRPRQSNARCIRLTGVSLAVRFGLLCVAAALCAACSSDETVFVGRVPIDAAGGAGATDGGTTAGAAGASGAAAAGDLACLDEPTLGPEGYTWCTVAQASSTATWLSTPSPEEARVHAVSPEFSYSGMAAYFTDPPSVVSIGEFDQLVFEADVPAGEIFEIYIGRDTLTGCSYVLTGAGETEYVVDLRSPYWCWPSLCGNDLRAVGIMFRTHWRSAVDTTLVVTQVEFQTVSGPAGTVNGLNAGIGPGGYCWFAFAWDLGSASWQVPPSSGLAHVRASSPADASAGMGFELLDAPQDLTVFSRLELDATVPSGTEFSISAVVEEIEAEPRGCAWPQVGADTTTYVADFSDLSGCWGTPPFDLTATTRVELATPWADPGELDMRATAIRFVP